MIHLRAPFPAEIQQVSELCLLSKAAWGYDEAFIEACRDELSLSSNAIDHDWAQVAVQGDDIVGMCEVSIEEGVARLEKLFIHPNSMRLGIGNLLFDWCVERLCQEGLTFMTIDSDPFALDFYLKKGAEKVGETPSGSIEGRMLPQLTYQL